MLRQSLSVFAIVASGFLATAAAADEDHGIAKITTQELDLTYIDHVLSGRVGDRPVYALPLADEFGMRLMHRAGGNDFETVFKKVGEEFTATVASISTDGAETETVFRVTSVSGATGEIKGFLNDKAFSVKISSDTMNGHHYVNPLFEIDVAGKPYSFVLQGGEACIGCSVKLTFAILSMLGTTGTL